MSKGKTKKKKEKNERCQKVMISEVSRTLRTPDLALDPKPDPGVGGCVNASLAGFSPDWVMSDLLA